MEVDLAKLKLSCIKWQRQISAASVRITTGQTPANEDLLTAFCHSRKASGLALVAAAE